MKKVIALLLAMAMILSLAACGNKKNNEAADTGKKEETKTEDKKETKEKTDITMWCIATESDSNRPAYEKGIDEFTKAHPEINFTWEATENEAYKTKIKAAASANEMPDIFFTWGCGFLSDFVDSGRVYCLDEQYAKYKDLLGANQLGNHTFDGKVYAAPLSFNIVAMFCNMDLLKQAGYDDVPGTYDDLMKCCDALVAKNIIPFGCSGKENWCITEYLESIIEKSVGAPAMMDMYNRKQSWNNDGVADAVGKFQDMINKKYFDPEGIALGNDEVKNNFEQGKYAFYINGTWNCADFATAGLEDKVKVAEFPVIDSSKSQLGELIGGANDSLAVAASSKNPEVAADTALELSKIICKYQYLAGSGLPAWTPDYEVTGLNKLTMSVADIVGNAKQFILFGDNLLSAADTAIYLDYVAKSYACAIDGKGYAEGLDNDLSK